MEKTLNSGYQRY